MAEDVGVGAGDLVVLGVSERTAESGLREHLFIEPMELTPLLAELHAVGLREAIALSTCQRLEVFALTEDTADTARRVLDLLVRVTGVDAAALRAQGYSLQGPAALRHLFAVAASLDSRIVGEPHVLGQLKESHRRALEAGTIGPGLEAVLQCAYACAKRVRRGTRLGEQPVTITTSALVVARGVHGDLRRRRALLIGLGEMGEFIAGELMAAGVEDLVIVHRSLARAQAVARRLGVHYRPWDELGEALAGADVVVSAEGVGRFTVTTGLAEDALKARRREPIFFIDAAVPGDIDPAVAALDGAFVFDLEDLERVARAGKATREAAVAAAWDIVDQELVAFRRGRAERAAVPALSALRRRFEELRAEVLAGGKYDAAQATRLLVNRLLHDPSEILRAAASAGAGERDDLVRALHRLFRLGEQDDVPEDIRTGERRASPGKER